MDLKLISNEIMRKSIEDLTNDELSKVMNISLELEIKIKEIRKEIEKRLNKGICVNGFELTSTRPQKKWTNEDAVIDFLKDDYGDKMFDISLKSPSNIIKIVKKEDKITLLNTYICEVSNNTKISKND
ncbi:MAG: DUF2800 domain-containing protein [Gammaproteobacteria bacterium]|nr:DUF2800 domain-containing protein [Gammaproteobacteria bacterium]